MRALRCFVAVLLVLGLAAGASAEHHDNGLLKEVAAIGDALAKAMVEDDIDFMLGMYAEEAISLPNFGPRMQGIEAFRQSHEQMAAAGMKVLSFESEPTEAWEAGDQVIEIGRFAIELQMPGMPQNIKDKGKYLTIYVRDDDGALKIKAETWNTDMNPMEMMGGMMGGQEEAPTEHGRGE
jgi:ketosteroid isomerase-like protein